MLGSAQTARQKKIAEVHDGVSWNGSLDKGGIVVGDDVHITIDAEAILDD